MSGRQEAALFAAIWTGDAAGAAAALDAGADPEAVEADGRSALMAAVVAERGAIVRLLLDRGAEAGRQVALRVGPDGQTVVTEAAADCGDAETAQLLIDRGAEAGALPEELLAELTGADRIAAVAISAEDFAAGRTRRFGSANPEPALEPFWQAQMRSGADGYSGGRRLFPTDEATCGGPPVWSFRRFGRTATRLTDGRWVLVGGEHEDHYDPDFCIYNDVTVLDGKGGVAHYLYPRAVFPPTDFHSATRLGDDIVLIGCLGYPEDRRAGVTPVHSLSLRDFSIRAVATSGEAPGWIHRHRATLDSGRIVVRGGKVEPGYRDLAGRWALDTETWRWSQVEN